MLSETNRDKVWIIFGLSAFGFSLLLTLFPIRDLIIVLNSVYAGSMLGIIMAYHRLIRATVAGSPPFDRARQYALGVFVLWAAYTVSVFLAIYSRAAGDYQTAYMMTAIHRYLAVMAAWLQVTAPDFGDGFFAGRDRKVLWIAVALSISASLVFLVAQDRVILS